ncbi:adenylate kinase [Favolaschia claudopus]|uniref:Adenylate kinase n=1 Tax=Favolaschia claudopus TaxID=2862362 RepID=A0AAW0B3N8_9AGAR
MSIFPRLVVVGGNGFIGSAVCRSALARGLQVTSISSSGRPYQTPKGHTPAWTAKVDWQKGDALKPESFAQHLDGASGVVHTIGILLEDAGYKRAVRDGDAPYLLRTLFADRNPLAPPETTYEMMNRDSALRVCQAFIDSAPPAEQTASSAAPARPFVFISAADVFRPWISTRYIETKRAAERGIDQLLSSHPERFRGVYLRPGLVYHAHHRPLSTPAAVLVDFTSTLHSSLPDVLRTSLRAAVNQLPGQSGDIPSPAVSIANAFTTPPIHVDHVGSAAVAACVAEDIRGVLDVRQMREAIGWRPTPRSSEGAVSMTSA